MTLYFENINIQILQAVHFTTTKTKHKEGVRMNRQCKNKEPLLDKTVSSAVKRLNLALKNRRSGRTKKGASSNHLNDVVLLLKWDMFNQCREVLQDVYNYLAKEKDTLNGIEKLIQKKLKTYAFKSEISAVA